MKIPDSMVLLRCGRCGYEDDYEAFTKAGVSGELDRGTYQCPSCRVAWRLERVGKGRVTESGFYIPPVNQVVEVEAVL